MSVFFRESFVLAALLFFCMKGIMISENKGLVACGPLRLCLSGLI